MWPPCSVYLAALVSRFTTTCSSRAAIGVQPDGLRRQRHRKFMPALVDQMANSLDRALHNATHRDVIKLEVDPAGADPGDVHQVIHQAGQLSHLTLNDVAGALLKRRSSDSDRRRCTALTMGASGLRSS